MQRARAAMLGTGRLVQVPGGRGMGEVALLGQMHRVHEDFTHTRDECPEEQRRNSDCRETFHSEQIWTVACPLSNRGTGASIGG